MPRLIIFDMNNLIYRSHHGVPEMRRADGALTNATYGTINGILKVQDLLKPTHWVAVFDNAEGLPGWRKKIDPTYKSNRKPLEGHVAKQFIFVREACDVLGIVRDERKNQEADDLIASYVNTFKSKPGMEIFIVSSDKDILQLVSDDNTGKVTVFDAMKSKIIKPADVIAVRGIESKYISCFLAFTGDIADCIKGTPGIGKKTAAILINRFGDDYDAMLAADDLPKGLKKRLKSGQISYEHALQLTTMNKDIKLKYKLVDLKVKVYDRQLLLKFLKSMSFNSIITRLKLDSKPVKSLFM